MKWFCGPSTWQNELPRDTRVGVVALPARHRSDDEERFGTRRDHVRQRCFRCGVREILLAGEESNKRTTLLGAVVAHGAAEHRIPRFERIEHSAQRHWRPDLESYLIAHTRKGAEMVGENDANHCSVCTSTESTAGRSRTIAFQESPPSAEA